MRISYWSSDVCSSDLAPSRGEIWVIQNSRFESLSTDIVPGFAAITVERPVGPDAHALCDQRTDVGVAGQEDWKSVVSGKSVSVRVDHGGSRIIKHKKYQDKNDDIHTINNNHTK